MIKSLISNTTKKSRQRVRNFCDANCMSERIPTTGGGSKAGLGDAWNEQVEQAWTEVYTLIAETMKSAGSPAQEVSRHLAA